MYLNICIYTYICEVSVSKQASPDTTIIIMTQIFRVYLWRENQPRSIPGRSDGLRPSGREVTVKNDVWKNLPTVNYSVRSFLKKNYRAGRLWPCGLSCSCDRGANLVKMYDSVSTSGGTSISCLCHPYNCPTGPQRLSNSSQDQVLKSPHSDSAKSSKGWSHRWVLFWLVIRHIGGHTACLLENLERIQMARSSYWGWPWKSRHIALLWNLGFRNHSWKNLHFPDDLPKKWNYDWLQPSLFFDSDVSDVDPHCRFAISLI